MPKSFAGNQLISKLAAENNEFGNMNRFLSLSQFKFDVWLIEQLRNAPFPGLTLGELRHRWLEVPGRRANLSRDMLTAHRKSIREFLGVEIQTPDRMHYRIMNPEALALDSLANDLLKSIQNFVFLQEYKELGNLIQPEQIETGACYLSQIGQALRDKRKLKITYQKFKDSVSYEAIVHPYCLKADKGRWYLFAHKEGSEHREYIQCFALDRTKCIEVMPASHNGAILSRVPFLDVPVPRFLLRVPQEVRHISFLHQVSRVFDDKTSILRIALYMIERMRRRAPGIAQRINHPQEQRAERVRRNGILPCLGTKSRNQFDDIRNKFHS